MKNSNNLYEDNRIIYLGVGIVIGLGILYLRGWVISF